MALKVDLTKDKPAPLRFEITQEDGSVDTLRVVFKKRLNRSQQQEIMYTKGRGRKAETRVDYRKLYKMTIEAIGPIEIEGAEGNGVGADGMVTDPDLIADIFLGGAIHQDIIDAVEEYAMGYNIVGDVEKNS